jgi:hypothetical protein
MKEIIMIATPPSPTDRAAFDSAIAAILSEHTTLKRLALAVSKPSGFSADATLSLADALTAHEGMEARLFSLPFLTRMPKSITSTGARAQQRCHDYTSGDFHLPDPSAAAAQFVDALLAHLAAEEAWLIHEREHHHERLLNAI